MREQQGSLGLATMLIFTPAIAWGIWTDPSPEVSQYADEVFWYGEGLGFLITLIEIGFLIRSVLRETR